MLTLTHATNEYKSAMSLCGSSAKVWDWLSLLRLEQYFGAFQSAGLATLKQCQNLTPEQLERMGITLPGHQRRILASLNKTLGNRDVHSQLGQPEGSEQTGHAEVIPRERSLHVPAKKTLERAGETRTPSPRARDKPVPRERQVSRMPENSREEGEMKTVPGRRRTAPGVGKEEEWNVGIDNKTTKPVPKERTKFRSPSDCQPNPLVSTACDTSLPPVPPRSTLNCPPQCFTPLCPSPPAQSPVSPRLDKPATVPPTAQIGSLSVTSPRTSAPVILEPPLHIPNAQSPQKRPQTLHIQPPAHHLSSDEGRKVSPTCPTAADGKNIPPLPPKAGSGSKGPPPVPQCFPAQSPQSYR